ncbi:MAG: Uma2 family endonuclease [Myxococcaceae bacterium]|nr:Uma2 family endonuclease [Myxococcaceae bacterium]
MSTARRLHFSYQDYLSALECSELKLEYCEGVIYAMAGGTPTHAELSVNAAAILKRELIGCSVFSSDLKVRVERTDLSAFPDVSVVCGERESSAIDRNALTNPILLVEVTSPSTEDYDRGEKLSHYKQLPSLAAVLFVSHRTQRITVVRRGATGWDELEFRAGERVVLQPPVLSFAVDEVYAGVTLER